ncbi:hypothetical protein LCGC14_2426640 [marine sediment metagenome]|uniref:Uncharacterized protein n=1 Tax=marine sediment metagenome TaxID=412755 RepID=A0A0F9CAC0_9ZZZZ
MSVSNQQLATMIKAVDDKVDDLTTRMGRVEDHMMNGQSNPGQRSSISPMVSLLVKWVIAPLIVILGAAFGVAPNLPLGG